MLVCNISSFAQHTKSMSHLMNAKCALPSHIKISNSELRSQASAYKKTKGNTN